MTRNKTIAAIAVAIVVVVVVVVLVFTLRPGSDDQSAATNGTGEPSVALTAPDELVEFSGKLELDELKNTSFVSLFVPDASGQPTSYMLDAARGPAKDFIQAVSKAKRVDREQPTDPPSMADPSVAAGDNGFTPTLTFVLVSRQMVTFVLDLENGLLFRDGQAFAPDSDLGPTVEEVINMQSKGH